MARLGRRVGDAGGGSGGAATSTTGAGALELRALVRRDALGAAGVVLAALALYARTACPTIHAGDSAELAAAAAVFGVPHPPEYPLYTLVTGLLLRVLPVADLGFAANLASALYAALAVGLAWLLFRRIGAGAAASTCGAAALALGTSFWSQATVAEVYGFDALLLFAVLHAALGLARDAGSGSRLRFGLVLGLWLGHRAVNLLLLPGIGALFVSLGGLRSALRAWPWIAAGAALTLPLWLYLPLASRADPGLDVGDPETLGRFWTVVRNEPYRRHLVGSSAAFASNRPERFFVGLPRELGIGLALAAAGAWFARRRRGGTALLASVGLICAANVLFDFHYHVLDIDAFYLPTYAALALLVALGAEGLLARSGARARLVAVVLVAGSLACLPWNAARNDRSGRDWTRLLAEDVLASTGERGVLFATGDAAAHSLWFLQEVERRAPELVVISTGHLRAWYVEQLRRRHPELPWPPFDERDPGAFLRATVDASIAVGPVYASLSANPALLGAGGARGDRYGTLIRGVVREVLPTGEYEVRTRARWNSDFLDAAVRRLQPVRRELDMDDKSTLLKYALALHENARTLAALGETELAIRDLEHLASLDPDRHERDVAHDVQAGLGRTLPIQAFGASAERTLAELRAR